MPQETDKATIDVEAQDDGVMGKIIFASGSKNVPVGEAIAVLAEEGDDLAKLEVPSDLSPEKQNIPKEDEKEAAPAAAPAKADPAPAAESAPAAAASTPAPSHKELDLSRPMLPAAAKL
jgi:pyruvate/2-oxoglutarate dehydrogenase complex dihydrolipoamide acyltransferase (E2) component